MKEIQRPRYLRQLVDSQWDGQARGSTSSPAWAMPDDDKRTRELRPFSLTGDSFRKIVVRNDIGHRWQDEKGVLHLSLLEFLLDESALA